MDIEMRGINGIEAVKASGSISLIIYYIQALMQTVFRDDDNIFNAICAGASGNFLKTTSPAGYIEAIKDMYNGAARWQALIALRVLELFQKNITPATANTNYRLTPGKKKYCSSS